MTADLPRKRTLAALLLTGAALGLGAGAIDRARGVQPATIRIFSEPPAQAQSPASGHPAAALAQSTRGAAAFQEIIR